MLKNQNNLILDLNDNLPVEGPGQDVVVDPFHQVNEQPEKFFTLADVNAATQHNLRKNTNIY
jgi:hypothetical protein